MATAAVAETEWGQRAQGDRDQWAVAARLRAERVRTLATIGLAAMGGGQPLINKTAVEAGTASANRKEPIAPGLPEKALGAARKLGGL